MTRQSGTPSVSVHGRFLKIESPKKLVYTWLWDGAFAEMPETTVPIDFAAVAGGTELSLRQEALAMPFCVQHLSGWTAALDRFSRVVYVPISLLQALDTLPIRDHAI
jgi:uncharacterized protein YndB with AHSA1/START domain